MDVDHVRAALWILGNKVDRAGPIETDDGFEVRIPWPTRVDLTKLMNIKTWKPPTERDVSMTNDGHNLVLRVSSREDPKHKDAADKERERRKNVRHPDFELPSLTELGAAVEDVARRATSDFVNHFFTDRRGFTSHVTEVVDDESGQRVWTLVMSCSLERSAAVAIRDLRSFTTLKGAQKMWVGLIDMNALPVARQLRSDDVLDYPDDPRDPGCDWRVCVGAELELARRDVAKKTVGGSRKRSFQTATATSTAKQ